MKEILTALSKVIVQGIMDWKFPLFLGALLTLNAVFLFVNEALRDYNDFAAVPTLTWIKLMVGAASAGIGALVPYLNSTVARTRAELQDRKDQPDEK